MRLTQDLLARMAPAMRRQVLDKAASSRSEKTRIPKAPSALEEELALQLRVANLAAFFVREHKFSERGWRIDFACLEKKIALEVEGITGGAGGRHQRKAGFESDCDKYNTLALEGWLLLRFTRIHLSSGAAIQLVERAIALR